MERHNQISLKLISERTDEEKNAYKKWMNEASVDEKDAVWVAANKYVVSTVLPFVRNELYHRLSGPQFRNTFRNSIRHIDGLKPILPPERDEH